jgi:hypothetical protein
VYRNLPQEMNSVKLNISVMNQPYPQNYEKTIILLVIRLCYIITRPRPEGLLRNIGEDEDVCRTYRDFKLRTFLQDYFNFKKKTEHIGVTVTH